MDNFLYRNKQNLILMLIITVFNISTVLLCCGFLGSKESPDSVEWGTALSEGLDSDLELDSEYKPMQDRETHQEAENIAFTELMNEFNQDDIVGCYKYGDYVFNFKYLGGYEGFFDAEDEYVTGYSYDIVMQNDTFVITIYNQDKTSFVTYNIMSLNDDELILYYEPAELEISLKSL